MRQVNFIEDEMLRTGHCFACHHSAFFHHSQIGCQSGVEDSTDICGCKVKFTEKMLLPLHSESPQAKSSSLSKPESDQ